ncbi:GNAT family N-acetyltransferase [Nocardioides kribbensis]|uniref:GNAT family N-acetyltransferase n=1 Tax=Nocardioides kribbensis TaxID=305517 RepID=A0ABV1P0X9_9ACTN
MSTSSPRPAPAVRLREATPDDAEALTHLHLDVWDDAYTGLVEQRVLDERRADVPARVERWRGILAGPREEPLWLAVEAGPGGGEELVGFASAGPARDGDVDTATELWSLYVRARLWGTGVGYALLQAAIGDRAAYLWVLAGNDRAIGFYERQGFRLDGTVDELDDGRHLRMLRAGT